MKRYKLQFSEQAIQDQEDLVAFIVESSKSRSVANSYVKRVRTAINGLKTFNGYKKCDIMADYYGPEVHRISYDRTSIVYTVHGDTVFIHRVMPSSQVRKKKKKGEEYYDDEQD